MGCRTGHGRLAAGAVRALELEQAALRRLAPGTARRLERKGEAENADRPDGLGRATGDAGPERPAADHERQALELAFAESADRRRPRDVELTQARVTAAPRRDTAARP